MFNETAGPPAVQRKVYSSLLSSSGGHYRTRQPGEIIGGRYRVEKLLSRRHDEKPCCTKCAQQGLSGCGCSPTEVIVIQEPTSELSSTSTAQADLPPWLIWVALGLGVVIILNK